MVLKVSTIAIILLAIFAVADLTRISRVEPEKFQKLAQIEAQSDKKGNKKPIFEGKIEKATIAVDGAEADSAGAPVGALDSPFALAQEGASQVSSAAFDFTVTKQLGVVPNDTMLPPVAVVSNDPPSILPKILDYITTASGYFSQQAILKAACDSNGFSCEEIVQIANATLVAYAGVPAYRWIEAVLLFADGRNNRGCISDPANAVSIVHLYESIWPATSGLASVSAMEERYLNALERALIDNDYLQPARIVETPPMQMQTGLRTEADIKKLLGDLKELQLSKAYWSSYWSEGGAARILNESGSSVQEEFEIWLKNIRSQGDQFSGSQLVRLVYSVPAIPFWSNQTYQFWWPIRILLQHLEQYVTGVTCDEVNQIIKLMHIGGGFWPEDLEPLKSIISDGQNKVDIVGFVDSIKDGEWDYMSPTNAEKVLQDVGVGLPPKNNPVFGVVNGNLVILVVDESTSMDTNFTLGDDTFTRRKFCHIQLEAALKLLPDGTYFNVIQYGSSAVKIFQRPVPVSKTNIDAAMEAMGIRWTSTYTPGQDAVEMLQNMQVFALKFLHQHNQSNKRNATGALRLAYTTLDDIFLGVPQIYFLTSGEPDGGASRILDNIDELDKRRNIPVNSIAFMSPTDLVAKQFVKDLAHKTGGFFRSIEQAHLFTNKTK